MPNKTTYEIQAKTKGFKNSEKQVKGLNGALGGLAKKAIGVAGAYFGSQMLLEGVRSSINAFAEQELAEKKLEQALGKTSTSLLKQASALQKVSIHGDEAIIAQQAFLASLVMSEQQIKDILPVAADLASATGMTLESAVRNTAKTFSGLAGELGELVPQLRELTAEEMKAGDAVRVMAELFGGAAQAEADTFSGKVTRVSNVLGDFAEDVGAVFVPALEQIADAFLKSTEKTEEQEKQIHEKRLFYINEVLDRERELMGNRVQWNAVNFTALKAEREVLEKMLGLSKEQSEQQRIEIQQLEDLDPKMSKHILNLEKVNVVTNDFTTISRGKLAVLKATAAIETVAGSQILANLASLNQATEGSAKLTKNLTIAQALGDAYAGGARAFRDYPFPASLLVAASSVAGGLAAVANVQSAYNQQNAQYGFEGVVTEPTQFTVGEGGAAEYVSVTPLEGVNNAGGGGVTVNVSGNVMSEQFVEEELAERIQEAVRKGVDFGIS